MRKILLVSLITASIMFGTDAKPLNDGPYKIKNNSSEIVNKNSELIKDNLDLSYKPNVEGRKVTTLINTPIKGILLTGYVFAVDNTPDSSISQNPLIFNDENSCQYIGSAKYSTNSERVMVHLEKKSCFNDGQFVESNIKGFVTENLMIGLKANVDYSNKIVAEVLSGRNVELFITEILSSNIIETNELLNKQQRIKEPTQVTKSEKEIVKEKLEKQYVKNGCDSLTKTKSETVNAFREKLKNCLTISYMQSIDEVTNGLDKPFKDNTLKTFINTYDIDNDSECINGYVWIKKYGAKTDDKCSYKEINNK